MNNNTELFSLNKQVVNIFSSIVKLQLLLSTLDFSRKIKIKEEFAIEMVLRTILYEIFQVCIFLREDPLNLVFDIDKGMICQGNRLQLWMKLSLLLIFDLTNTAVLNDKESKLFVQKRLTLINQFLPLCPVMKDLGMAQLLIARDKKIKGIKKGETLDSSFINR